MGFWGTLGKIASVAAPIVAAPFTGGTSLALLGAIGAGGQVASAAAGAMGAGRQAENQEEMLRDRSRLDLYQQQREAATKDRDAFAKQALRAEILRNLQDVQAPATTGSGVAIPRFEGGMRPSNLGPEFRQFQADLQKRAILDALSDKTAMPGAPTLSQHKKAGFWEKALGIGGGIAQGVSAVGGSFRRPTVMSGVPTTAGRTA